MPRAPLHAVLGLMGLGCLLLLLAATATAKAEPSAAAAGTAAAAPDAAPPAAAGPCPHNRAPCSCSSQCCGGSFCVQYLPTPAHAPPPPELPPGSPQRLTALAAAAGGVRQVAGGAGGAGVCLNASTIAVVLNRTLQVQPGFPWPGPRTPGYLLPGRLTAFVCQGPTTK
ncbi:hypothetical protein HYH03_008388 [Edaphochlamys debaryana]|uniref:Uncharacterized protein n=1 Tax=Edaphochlamys debaryana TaxID=47281 RepID=A0A835Y695_9CHLO|nr:hypothetical protein HYH03_008388 [Edaphochlamys debaryana]|eukprot:KAG2493250.1 hypothetical protein HYH03_008388 [Edaphochlamys debaryana]